MSCTDSYIPYAWICFCTSSTIEVYESKICCCFRRHSGKNQNKYSNFKLWHTHINELQRILLYKRKFLSWFCRKYIMNVANHFRCFGQKFDKIPRTVFQFCILPQETGPLGLAGLYYASTENLADSSWIACNAQLEEIISEGAFVFLCKTVFSQNISSIFHSNLRC